MAEAQSAPCSARALETEDAVMSSKGTSSARSSQSYAQSYRQSLVSEHGIAVGDANGNDEVNRSGVPGGILNLANTIIGAALTGLPNVTSVSGVIPYIVFLCISAVVAHESLRFLVNSCDWMDPGNRDYPTLGARAWGHAGNNASIIGICLATFGALTAYFVLAGLNAPAVMKQLNIEMPAYQIQAALAVFPILPLCLLKNISALAPSSLLALSVFSLVAVYSVYSFVIQDNFYTSDWAKQHGAKDSGFIQWFPSSFGMAQLASFPTVVMAFNAHYALLPIYSNMKGGTKEMYKVCKGGISIALLVYVLVGTCGYLAFKGNTMQMILLNFRHCVSPLMCKDDSRFASYLSGLFLLAVLLGYPCVHFCFRRAQISLLFGTQSTFDWRIHCGLACCNILATYGLAVIVGENIKEVFNWIGTIASPLIVFILPSGFYYSLLSENSMPRSRPLMLLIYGCLVVCIGLFNNIAQRSK